MTTVAEVARNLRTIRELAGSLEDQAVAKANDASLPGGDAMVNLAYVADLTVWQRRVDLAEAHGGIDLADEDPDDLWPPFQQLRFWSEAWRIELDMENYDDPRWRPTLATEAEFLANPDVLAWARDHEHHWDDFADDVRKALARLENLMSAGERAQRVRIVCPDCDAGRRLIVVFGAKNEDDRWKCPACKHKFTAEQLPDAYGKQLRNAGAARWVPVLDAMSVLKTQGWQERTVRQWFTDLRIDLMCDLETGKAVAWWPDVWRVHLTERQRREVMAQKLAALRQRKAACDAEHGADCWVKGRGCGVVLGETTAV